MIVSNNGNFDLYVKKAMARFILNLITSDKFSLLDCFDLIKMQIKLRIFCSK
jgi:hypothetical protein